MCIRDREHIANFVKTNDVEELGGASSELAMSIDQKLIDVKICDPAIGSGAFPTVVDTAQETVRLLVRDTRDRRLVQELQDLVSKVDRCQYIEDCLRAVSYTHLDVYKRQEEI